MPVSCEPRLWEAAALHLARRPVPDCVKAVRTVSSPGLDKIPKLMPASKLAVALESRTHLETEVHNQCCVPSHLISPGSLEPQPRQWMRVLHRPWRRVQLQREVDIWWLLIDSGCLKTLTNIDPECSFTKGWRGRIYVVITLRGSEYRGRTRQMLSRI